MTSFFITGTNTGVGKTLVTAGLAAFLRRRGKSVCIYKPIQTGCKVVNAKTGELDPPGDLAECQELLGEADLPVFCSYVFEPATAPYSADPGRTIQPEKLLADYRKLKNQYDHILVEGAGGIRVPVSPGFEMLDLAKMLDLPVLVVSSPQLGTINHTLLTVSAIQSAGLTVPGIVISGGCPPGEALADHCDPALATLKETLNAFLLVPILAILPDFPVEPGLFNPDRSVHLEHFKPVFPTSKM